MFKIADVEIPLNPTSRSVSVNTGTDVQHLLTQSYGVTLPQYTQAETLEFTFAQNLPLPTLLYGDILNGAVGLTVNTLVQQVIFVKGQSGTVHVCQYPTLTQIMQFPTDVGVKDVCTDNLYVYALVPLGIKKYNSAGDLLFTYSLSNILGNSVNIAWDFDVGCIVLLTDLGIVYDLDVSTGIITRRGQIPTKNQGLLVSSGMLITGSDRLYGYDIEHGYLFQFWPPGIYRSRIMSLSIDVDEKVLVLTPSNLFSTPLPWPITVLYSLTPYIGTVVDIENERGMSYKALLKLASWQQDAYKQDRYKINIVLNRVGEVY